MGYLESEKKFYRRVLVLNERLLEISQFAPRISGITWILSDSKDARLSSLSELIQTPVSKKPFTNVHLVYNWKSRVSK